MTSVAAGGIAMVALLGLHLVAEARGGAPVLRAVGKLGASAAFVAVALSRGAHGAFGRAVLAGLVLSAIGDALLLSKGRLAFLGGLVAFLVAHVAYALAFSRVSHPFAWGALAVAIATVAALRWLWPFLGQMRIPVVAYCAVIGVMVWLALGVPRPEVRAGALLFWASDLLVARDRFVRPGLANRLAGLPLYYAAQLLLASAVA